MVSVNRPEKIIDYYILIYSPNHERSFAEGYIPEQILVAEEVLGRKLTQDESIKHINGKPHDNRPTNLEVISTNAGYKTQVVETDNVFQSKRAPNKSFIPCKFQRECWKTIRGPLAKKEGIYLPYLCSFQSEGDVYKCSRFWAFLDAKISEDEGSKE